MRTKTQFIVTPADAHDRMILDAYGSVWTFAIVHTPSWAGCTRYIVPTVSTSHPDKLIYWLRSQIKLHS